MLEPSDTLFRLSNIFCAPFPGTYAVMSVMIGGVTERLVPSSDYTIWDNVTNSSIVNEDLMNQERVRVAAAVTFLSGIFQVSKREYPFTMFSYVPMCLLFPFQCI